MTWELDSSVVTYDSDAMKIADFFSALRIFMAPVFFVLFFIPVWSGIEMPFLIVFLVPFFVFMQFTDFLDGYFARKRNEVSDFGKLFDPFADVIANVTVLLCFMLTGYLPAFLFLLILYREMGILFLRMLAMKQGIAMGARKGGKTKTVLYITASGFSLMIELFRRLDVVFAGTDSLLPTVNLVLYALAVLVSLGSFIDYLFHYRSLIRASGTV